jgi:hypothetical protein
MILEGLATVRITLLIQDEQRSRAGYQQEHNRTKRRNSQVFHGTPLETRTLCQTGMSASGFNGKLPALNHSGVLEIG